MLVEVDDEHFVFLVAGVHESPGGGNHFRNLFPHAAAVIDDQAHRDRNVFVAEQADGLADAVFVHRKILLAQLGSKLAVAVAHGGLQDHQIDVHRNPERRILRLDSARETGQEKQRESCRIEGTHS